jgi:PAS domain S-box-containing protein
VAAQDIPQDLMKELEALRLKVSEFDRLRREAESAQAALQESEKRYRELYEFAPVAYFTLTIDGEILTVNRRAVELLGYDELDLVGRSFLDLLTANLTESETEIRHRLLNGAVVAGQPYELQRADGPSVWVLLSVRVIRATNGRVIRRKVAAQDITLWKLAEDALHHQHHMMRGVIEGTTEAIFVKDLDGRYLMINSAGARVAGTTIEEFVGKVDHDLFPRHVADILREDDQRVIREGVVEAIERTLVVGDEEKVYLTTKGVYRDDEGNALGLIGVGRDITDQKRMIQALKLSEARYRSLVESAMDAIIAIDAMGNVQLFNTAAEEVFQCAADDVVGTSFDRFASQRFRDLLHGYMEAIHRKESPKRYMWVPDGLTARRLDGAEFPVEATISHSPQGMESVLTIILRDVNERKSAQAEILKLEQENVYLREEIEAELGGEEIVGTSRGMRLVLEEVKQVSDTDSTVLITGETGTGKELLARAIHNLSRRSNQPMVKVNCAALPSGLIESELFGHEKGAFTGALAQKIGRFELANNGTIFLDEIGDLPLELQAKLLRVLQEGEFERVGGAQTHKVDARVVAATNRDLNQDVESGRFRADLFYRLNVFPINIPPLRERVEDIPLLVRRFVMKYAAKMGREVHAIDPHRLDMLKAYDWPGNVRELQNVIERAMIVSQSGSLDFNIWQPSAASESNSETAVPTLERIEKEHISKVLKLTNGRVSGKKGAARILGLKPTTLEARMKKWNISRES